jgi:glycerol uptake facilitator-like aquaporin
MQMLTKRTIISGLAELIGTFALALVILSVSKSSLGVPFFIAVAGGLAVAGMSLLLGGTSGAQLNPAITLGLYSAKRLDAFKALVFVIAQLVGGLMAYYVFAYFSGQRWRGGGHFEMRLVLAETLGTFMFALGWAAAVTRKLEAGTAAALVGLSFALALLAVSSAGVVLLNPALDLSLRSWVWGSSVIGPIIGSVAGFQAYKFLFTRQAQEPRS